MDANAKQQVVEKLKGATNILVCVSRDPSVDQLSAAIGFSLLLNKIEKHATSVYSGKTPSTIDFLNPKAQFQKTTDSLQDFIISLDRAKADKLRYKVEDNVVKIFITPNKTTLSPSDLEYSQGDFNIDVVVALGVVERDHLDEAILSHGRILHDATVLTVVAGETPSNLGSINWTDNNASSLCEMLVSISESFKSGLLDEQMSTAFLTGIVSETDRFKNQKTSPKVMTMSAQLMAAGANQQLIADSLVQPEPEQVVKSTPKPEPEPEPVKEPENNAGSVVDDLPSIIEEQKKDELPDVQPEPEPEPEFPADVEGATSDSSTSSEASKETKPPELSMEDLNKASVEYKSSDPEVVIEGQPENTPDEIHIDHSGQFKTSEQMAKEVSESLNKKPEPSGHSLLGSKDDEDKSDSSSEPEETTMEHKKKKVIAPIGHKPQTDKTDLSDPAAVAASLGQSDDVIERVSLDEVRKKVDQAAEIGGGPVPQAEEAINSIPVDMSSPPPLPPPPSAPPPIG